MFGLLAGSGGLRVARRKRQHELDEVVAAHVPGLVVLDSDLGEIYH